MAGNFGALLRELDDFARDRDNRALRKAARGYDEQAELYSKVRRATTMLKSLVSDGRLTALQACAFEARIHHLNEQLR
jgi:hypothetical protein